MQSRSSARSRKGCLTCRGRKVKCDERRSRCGPCERLDLDCRWTSAQAGRSLSRSRSPLRRPAEQRDTRSSGGASIAAGQDLVRKQDLRTFIAAYYRFFHSFQSNGFLHRPTLERNFAEGTIDELTIKTICAVSFRYLDGNNGSSDPDGGPQAAQWAQEIKAALMEESDRVGYSKLVASLCLVQHELAAGRNASAWIICALAARFALAMGLNMENERDSAQPKRPAEVEFRHRLMWSAYCSDCICHGGLNEYSLLPPSVMRIPLPGSEYGYTMSIANTQPLWIDQLNEAPAASSLSSSDGLMARYVRLMTFRSQILHYVKHFESQVKPWDPQSPFDRIVSGLRIWSETLPAEMRFNLDNLDARQSIDELGPFMLLHMWYDGLHSSLYRLAIPGHDESASAESLRDAPVGWVERVRAATYIRACSLRQKFVLLDQHFPDYRPESWQFATLAIENTRNILQYLSLEPPQSEDQHRETAQAFETVLTVISRMIPVMHSVRVKLTDLIRILARHGYDMPPGLIQHDVQQPSGRATPARGPLLSRLPMFRRHLRFPDLQDTPRGEYQYLVSQGQELESDGFLTRQPDAVDPVSHELLSVSPGACAASGAALDARTETHLALSPPEYSSWPQSQQDIAPLGDVYDTLWGVFSHNVVADLGLDVIDPMWTAFRYEPDPANDPSVPPGDPAGEPQER